MRRIREKLTTHFPSGTQVPAELANQLTDLVNELIDLINEGVGIIEMLGKKAGYDLGDSPPRSTSYRAEELLKKIRGHE